MARKTPAQRRLEKVALQMERFNEPLPSDYDEFVQNDVLPTYIFYNGKKGTGYCTTCRSDFKIKGLHHRKSAVCPVCGRRGMARSEGYSRTESENFWSMFIYQQDGDTLVRYFRHNIFYGNDYRNPKIYTLEQFRRVNDTQFMYELRSGTAYHKWDEYRPNAFFNYMTPRDSDWYIPYHSRLYKENLDVIKESLPDDCKYMPLAELIECAVDVFDHFYSNIKELVEFYRGHRYCEQLFKVGFKSIVKDLMRGRKEVVLVNVIDSTQTELVKVLRLDKRRYAIIKNIFEPDLDDVRLLQAFPNISCGDFYWLRSHDYYSYYGEHLRIALKYSTVSKVKKYIQEKKLTQKTNWYVRQENDVTYWRDYLRNCEELGIDLNDEYYLFPKDLVREHDRAYQLVVERKSKIEAERRKKESRLIKKIAKEKATFAPFHLHYNGLFIRCAESREELRKEGDALHHCVETYASRMAEGKTFILFVRKESDPDTPYFTMEWKGSIIQLRGKHNCNPTEDVKEFRKVFEKECEKALATNEQAKAA